MNPLAIIPLSAAVGIGFLGTVLFLQHSRQQSVRIFIRYCALGTYLSSLEFLLSNGATTREGAVLWQQAGCLWPLAPTLLLHFLLLESRLWRNGRRYWLGAALYIPAFGAILLHFVPGALAPGLRETRWGFVDVHVDTLIDKAVVAWAALVGALTITVGIYNWLSRNKSPSQRRQAEYIALGTSIPIITHTVLSGILPSLKVYAPPLSGLGTLACAILISYAVHRLKLFVLSPAAVADLIVSGMSDLLFLCGPDGKIQRINRAALHILGCREEELLGRPAEEVLPQLDATRDRAVSVKEMETSVKTRDRRSLTLSLSTSSIRDDDGQLLGILLIGRDITDRKRAEASRQLLVRSMIQAQDEERRRIARELHDETGQTLGSLIAELRVLEDQLRELRGEEARARVAALRNVVAHAMQEVQRISRGMHPGVLDALGLAAALRHYADEFARLQDIKVTSEIVGLESEERLPPEVETTVYRVVQEAFTNVARHSQAKVVSLFVVRQNGTLRAIIEDDGKGFDPEAPGPPGGVPLGLGIVSIRERVSLLGGSVRLETAPGEGVTLKIELPLEPRKREQAEK